MERNGYTSGALISRFNDLSRKCVDIHFYTRAKFYPVYGSWLYNRRILPNLFYSYSPTLILESFRFIAYDSSSNRLFSGQFHFPANSSYRFFLSFPFLFFFFFSSFLLFRSKSAFILLRSRSLKEEEIRDREVTCARYILYRGDRR